MSTQKIATSDWVCDKIGFVICVFVGNVLI